MSTVDLGSFLTIIVYALVAFYIVVSVIIALVKGLYRMLVHVGCVSVAVVLSVFITKWISPLIAPTLFSTLYSVVPDLEQYLSLGVLQLYPVTAEHLYGIIGSVLAFVVFFAVLYLVAFIASIFVGRMVPGKNDTPKIHTLTSVAVGIVAGFLFSTVVFAPVGYLTSIASEVLPKISPKESQSIEETLDRFNSNPCVVVSQSKPYTVAMDYMFSYGGSQGSSLRKDVALVSDAFDVIYALDAEEGEEVTKEDIERVLEFFNSVRQNPTFINVYTEVVSVSAKELLANRTVFGLSLKEIKSSSEDPYMTTLVLDLIDYLSELNTEATIQDFATIYETLLILKDSPILKEFDIDNPLLMFTDPEQVSSVIVPMLKNERFHRIFVSFTAYGISTAADSIGIAQKDINSISASIRHSRGAEGNNTPEEEARVLAEALCSLVTIMDKLSSTDGQSSLFNKDTIADFQMVIKMLGKSDIVSNDALSILAKGAMDQLNNSLPEMEFDGFTDLIQNTIKGESDTDIEQLLNCATAGVAVADSLTNGTKPSDEDVQVLVSNMNQEIADSLKDVYSDNYFTSLGVPEDKSGNCNKFVSEILDNMAAVDTNDDNIKQETAAVSNLIEIAQLQTEADKSAFLSTKEESDEFVQNCVSSTIFTDTLESFCVDESGNSVADPLGFAGKLDENAKNNLVDSLTSINENGSEEHKKACDYIALIVLGHSIH